MVAMCPKTAQPNVTEIMGIVKVDVGQVGWENNVIGVITIITSPEVTVRSVVSSATTRVIVPVEDALVDVVRDIGENVVKTPAVHHVKNRSVSITTELVQTWVALIDFTGLSVRESVVTVLVTGLADCV